MPRSILPCLALVASASLVPAVATLRAQEPGGPERVEIRSLLAVPGGRGGRVPVAADPVEAMLARGTWQTPEDGAELAAGGRTRQWTRLEAGEDGAFRDRALRGGWAVATVEVARAGVWMLEARGHRHVYVNGVPRGGDVYDLGFVQLPVVLREGPNELLFRGGRGALRAALVAPRAEAVFLPGDRTLPDVVRGEDGPLLAGVVVANCVASAREGLVVRAAAGGRMLDTALPELVTASTRKVAVQLPVPGELTTDRLEIALELRSGDRVIDSTMLALAVRDSAATHQRTFLSAIDGSVQYYGVTPRIPGEVDDPSQPPALYLSLHGAGVEGIGQARAYRPKEDGYVVAPTNRRPFGFDWEDWGRLDALEVLALAQERFGTDPRRTYLTGHSMGGHGTWIVGVQFPDRFAAIAPSAGWRDFWSYAGGRDVDTGTPAREALARATNVSRTLLLERNLLHGGVYVLHGDADDNVPVGQARFMRERLGTFHPNFAYYERPGAGHWWGNACVDWPPLFDFLRQNELPESGAVRHVEFATVNPAVSARCDWLTVEAQQRSLALSTADVAIDPDAGKVTGRTENVARLRLDLAAAGIERRETIAIALDDGEASVPFPEDGRLRLMRNAEGAWGAADELDPAHKGPHRAGPFKDAFRHRMVFVFGTAGDDEENAWSLQKARFDAETFWYRGNGSIDVIADRDFDGQRYADRGVVVYGNADTNALWSVLLADSPVRIDRGGVTVGEQRFEGDDLACLLVRPRPDSDVACVAVVAGTGMPGARVTDQLPYFVSGVHYPDWTVLGVDVLERGVDGVRAAGFFGPDWSL